MLPLDSKQAIESAFQRADVQFSTSVPKDGVGLFLAFYYDVRAFGCDLAADGDMLLYQWGTHDWGQGPQFELDITRQFIVANGEDAEMSQLSLTYRYKPTAGRNALGEGNRWCPSPAECDDFRTFIESTAAFAMHKGAHANLVKLDLGAV